MVVDEIARMLKRGSCREAGGPEIGSGHKNCRGIGSSWCWYWSLELANWLPWLAIWRWLVADGLVGPEWRVLKA